MIVDYTCVLVFLLSHTKPSVRKGAPYVTQSIFSKESEVVDARVMGGGEGGGGEEV